MKDIIRFRENGRRKLIHCNVTEDQAREWCESRLTRKEGKYFDGFAATGTYCTKKTPVYTHYFAPTDEYC